MPDNSNALRSALASAILGDTPLWSWHYTYNPQLHDHLHAIGVIAANYNKMEATFNLLFASLVKKGIPEKAAFYLFQKLNNSERTEFLAKVIEAGDQDQNLSRKILFFLKGYAVCCENRNILMHAQPSSELHVEMPALLELKKASKKEPTKFNKISLALADLRRIADDLHRFEGFATAILLFMFRERLEAKKTISSPFWRDYDNLPDDPAPPFKLNLPAA